MPVQLTCPACQAKLTLDVAHLGKKISCAGCKHVFTAAAPKPTEESHAVKVEPHPSPVNPAKTNTKTKSTRPGKPKQPTRASLFPLVVLLLALGSIGIALFGCVVGIGAIVYLNAKPDQPLAANKNKIGPENPIAQLPLDVDKEKARDPGPIDEPEEKKIEEKKVEEKREEPKEFKPLPFEEKKVPEPIEEKKIPLPFKKKFREPEPNPVAGDVPIVAEFPPHDPSMLTLKPCKLEEQHVTRTLPGTMDDVAVGGGGRFILFNLPQLRKIGMLDVNEGKIVHYFPTAGDGVKFSAGLTKLVVVFPETRIIQRWDLLTREKELTVALPDIGAPRMVLLGSASQGPVLVVGQGDHPSYRAGKSVFLNLTSFKESKLNVSNTRRSFPAGYTRVSADGTVFGCWEPDISPQGQQSYVLSGNQLKGHYEHNSVGHIVPGPDGKILYTATGMYTNENRPIGDAAENRNHWVIPSIQGNFYLSAQNGVAPVRKGKKGKFVPPPRAGENASLALYMVGHPRPLLEGIEFPGADRFARDGFGNDKRVLFVPGAEVLITIPQTNDRFELHRINLDEALDKSGIDYLYVASRAPDVVQRGADYQYKLIVKSKKGGLKYKLDAGPAGMKVSADGTVGWKVPAEQDLAEELVLLTVSDAGGQEVFHTFKVRVVADPLPKIAAKEVKLDEPKKQPVGKDFDPPIVKPVVFGDIRPVKLDAARVERMLPGNLSNICVGGGGRFLLITIPTQRKVALFDANEGKIVHYFPLTGDNAHVAGGKEHMIVAYPDSSILQRWNLLTREKELTVASPFNDTIQSITMGYDSHGPIFVSFKERDFRGAAPQFLDLKFKPLNMNVDGRISGNPAFPHASADGTLIGFRDGVGAEGHSVQLIHVTDNKAKVISIGASTSTLVGSPDGRFVYTGTGIFNTDMKIVHPLVEQTSFAKPFLPSLHGPYFMRLDFKQWDQHGGSIALFFQGNYTPFATLDNIEGVTNEQIAYGSNRDTLTYSKRIFLIPGANLLVSVPRTNDRLILHQVDMNELLAKSPIDYLLIASHAPSQVARGEKLQYKIDVRSKKGGVRFTLDAGPKGMTISPQGEVTWTVPADYALGSETVIVTVRDAAGQETFHTFRLSVMAGKN